MRIIIEVPEQGAGPVTTTTIGDLATTGLGVDAVNGGGARIGESLAGAVNGPSDDAMATAVDGGGAPGVGRGNGRLAAMGLDAFSGGAAPGFERAPG